jgi:hypothetical protein
VKHVYRYSPASGVETAVVIRATRDAVTVASGISGQVVRRSELDAPGAAYFTSARRAVGSFVAKAQAALADPSRERHHAGWREALADARARLEDLP